MGALKLTACMKVVSEMSDLDRDALLDRLDGYLDDGVPKERAQVMAASDMLAELEDERREFMRMLKEQHPEIFVVTAPQVRQSADRPIFTDDILRTAIAESKAMSGVIGSAIESDAQGVIPGRPRMLDRGLAKGTYTEEEVQAEFPRTLEAIRAAHGEELTLWRADAPADRRIAEARTVYMADQDVATKYANNGRQALPYRVKTDDLLGVYARPSGYYEAIVRIPEGGLKPADGEGLRQSADRITDTPEFKRWFGNSKVVDADGQPLVVYHGSPVVDFNVFDLEKVNANDPDGPYNGFWFSTEEQSALQSGKFPWGRPNAADAQVRSFYLSMQNPATRQQARKVAREIEDDWRELYPSARSLQDAARLELMTRGFDGVVHSKPIQMTDELRRRIDAAADGEQVPVGKGTYSIARDGDAEYSLWSESVGKITSYDSAEDALGAVSEGIFVAFRPEQVKSATSNNGQFDPTNPDITKSADRTPLGFYSALARSIDGAPIKSAPAGAWKTAIKGLLNKGAVKQDELEWSGLEDWLDLEGQPKPVYESGYGLVEEYQKDDGTWEQVDDLGSYFRTQEEAEAGITDEMRQASEKWAKKEGATSRVAVKKFDQLNFGKTMTPKISKEQVAEYLKQGGVQVEETVLGGTDYAGGLHVDQSDSGSWHVVDDEARVFDGPFDTEEEADAAMAKMAQGQAPSKYSQYTLPGGENYREVLLTLPSKEPTTVTRFQVLTSRGELVQTVRDRARAERLAEGLEGYTVREVQMPGSDNPGANLYRSNHWNQPNVLAHIRMNDRTDAEGKRVLFVEELQSDWGQEGKKKGFKGEPQFVAGMEGDPAGFIGANASGVPKAPFVNKTEGWLNLALKRVMVMAAEGGYDKVAFTTGSQNAERFSLDKHLREIAYEPAGDGKYEITATDLRGREVISEDEVGLDRVEELVGKEIAEKVSRDEGERDAGGYREWRYLRGDNLKVEAKGMRAFYDTIVPTALKKLLPKVGGEQVGVVNINSDFNVFQIDDGLWGNNVDERTFSSEAEARKAAGTPQPGFDVTDAMREKVAGGLPLFSPDRVLQDKDDAVKAIDLVKKARAYQPEEGEARIAFPLLFHSGTGDPRSIANYIEPQFGSWVAEVLDGAYDSNNEDEAIDPDEAFVPLSYYSPSPEWIRIQTARKMDKPFNDVTLDDIRKNGQLALVYNVDDTFGDAVNEVYQIGPDGYNGGYTDVIDVYGQKRKLYETGLEEEGDYRGGPKQLFGVEPGDIVSKEMITPDLVLVGDALVEFMRQYQSQIDPEIRFSPDRAQIKTPEFKKWFGKSKVVNGIGKPRVVYHGTAGDVAIFDMGRAGQTYGLKDEQAFFFTGYIPTAESAADDATDLPVYRRKYMNEGFGGGMDRGDSYGGYDDGDSYDYTADYNGGQNIMPVYLSLQNPLIIDADQGYGAGTHLELRGSESPGELIARAKAEGHDGIIIRGKYRNYESIARINNNNWLSDQEKKKYLDRLAREDARKQQTDNYFIAFRPDQIKSAIGNIGAFGQRPVTAEEAERFGMGEMEAEYRQYEGDIRFSVDRGYKPEKTVTAYKLFRMDERRPGELFPLFVDADKPVPMGKWLRAQAGTPAADGKVKSKLGPLAYRPGWHAGDLPVATHIGMKKAASDKKPGLRNPEHVWAEVEMAADVDWQAEANKRGTNKDGKVVPVKAHITDQIPRRGFYRYKTNPNMTGNWLIGGEMKVLRLLSDDEVQRINDDAGAADLPRAEPLDLGRFGFDGAPEITKSADRLIEDIPNEDWLQGKIDYAKSKGRNQFGVPFMGAITGYFKGPVDVSLRVLSKLKGERDEQNNVRDESLDYIRQNWDEVSKQPPYIEVAYNGEAWVSEGNHRIMVAAEKGLESMPVEIRYFDGGQRMSGPLAPGRIPSLEAPDIFKSADRPWFDDLSKFKVSTNYQLGDLLKSSKKLNWWNRNVGTQYNLAQKNPEFKRVFDAVQTFINDVSAYAARAADLAPTILPKLETLKDLAKSPLSAEDVKALRDPIFGGTLKYTRDDEGDIIEADDVSTAGVVFTNDELRDLFGLNDRQVKLYREFRRATNKSLSDLAVADMLRYLGKDGEGVRQRALEATNLDGALDAMVAHLDMMIEQQPERAEVLEDSKRAIKEKAGQAIGLMARGYAPLSRFGQYTVYVVGKDGEQIYFSMFETQRDANKMAREMQEQYPEAKVTTGIMSQESYKLFSGVTPETLALFGESLGLEESGIDAKSEAFQQYLKMAKTNRSAMKRLIQRKGIDGFSEDAGRVLAGFVYSNARQISTNLHAGEIGRAASEIQDGDVKDHAIRLMEYIQNPTEEAQALKGLLFNVFLGGNISSALVNISQTATTTFPYLSQFDGAASVMKRLGDATKLAVRGIRGDDELRQALKRAEDEGVVSPQEVFHLMAQAQGKAQLRTGDGTRLGDALAKTNNFMTRATLVWGRLFSAAEQANRRIAFIAAYKLARDKGMENPFAFAEKTVLETQFSTNKGIRPVWARGPVGGVLFTFKGFTVAYLELLGRMLGNGPEGRKAFGLALGTLFLFAGAGGLPFLDDLDDAIDAFAQRVLNKSFDSRQAKREFFASLIGQTGADFVMSGISGLPGAPIDVSGRLGLGNIIPGTGILPKKSNYQRDVMEVLGPAGSLFSNYATAVGMLAQGEVGSAAMTAAPVGIQNVVKGMDMAQMGFYRDTRGRKVIDTNGWEAVAKSMGFQPSSVKRIQDATSTQQGLIAQNKLRETEIADKMAKARIERKPELAEEAREELADWNRKNPQSPIRIDAAQINRRVQQAMMDKAKRIEKTAPQEIRAAVKQELERAQ